MFTIERVIDELNKLCAADHITLDIPVVVNGRLTRSMGRVKYIVASEDVYLPEKIEFSRNLLENASDEDIMQVIKHEYVHFYLLTVEPTIEHGHDAVFKAKCAEINCTHSKSAQHVEGFRDDSRKMKYEVWCPDCNKIIGTFARRGKTINNIDRCGCKICGCRTLKVVQNW